jgi:hypothetical protein
MAMITSRFAATWTPRSKARAKMGFTYEQGFCSSSGRQKYLLLAQCTTRQHELAVRSAIGESRAQLVGQLFTAALVLAITGGAWG